MKVSKDFFVRYEPNFIGDKKFIIYDKKNDKIYKLNYIYYLFLNSVDKKDFISKLDNELGIKDKVESNNIYKTIEKNLIKIGILI